MSKILRVSCESDFGSQTTYFRVADDETEARLEDIASVEFYNFANYGYSIVDESEVPSDEEIVDAS